VESRLCRSDWNFEDGGDFFERKIVLVAEQEDGTAGGRNKIQEGEEGLVRDFAVIGVECGDGFGPGGVEGLPSASAFQVGEGNAGGYAVGPWPKDGWLAQKMKLAKDLDRGLLKDIVGEVKTDEPGDVTTQRSMNVVEELFHRSPVAGLGKKDEQGLVWRLGLLRVHA
jgi:hypothetical protein